MLSLLDSDQFHVFFFVNPLIIDDFRILFLKDIVSTIFLLQKMYPTHIFTGIKYKNLFLGKLWAFNMWAFSDKR